MQINYTAPINTLSYGIVGLNVLEQLHIKDHEVTWFPIGNSEAAPEYHAMIQECIDRPYKKDSPSIRLFHQFDLAHHVGRGLHIGWSIFELDKFNDRELNHLKNQDILVVCSEWAKEVLNENCIYNPVHVVPLGVDADIFFPAKPAMPDEVCTFITIGKKENRKGYAELLECFERAFTPRDKVKLRVLWGSQLIEYNYPQVHNDWINYYKRSKLSDKIELVEWLPNQMAVANLINQSDCGVFLSKAEGFNFGLLETMACGLPVICTNVTAHTEYVSNDNAFLVECPDKEPAYDGVWFHGQGNWHNIDCGAKDQVIDYMRHMYKLKMDGENMFTPEGVDTAKRFSWASAADKLIGAIS